ncbi:hypothetical protein O3S80_01335 [Streptomyces sp. Lzd4kr]|nr:hypothetical protein [Streptomyces sp. Lzd4kr]
MLNKSNEYEAPSRTYEPILVCIQKTERLLMMIAGTIVALVMAVFGATFALRPRALQKVSRPIRSPFFKNYDAVQPSDLGVAVSRVFGLALIALAIYTIIKVY